MKQFVVFTFFLAVILNNTLMFAQEDNVPYLSDDDIASLEIILPEDIPIKPTSIKSESVVEVQGVVELNEISRINASQSIYHLLILDRVHCSLNSDISGTNNITMLYKLKHGKNGYLIAIYRSSNEGPIFPILPEKSRIIVDLLTARKETITEYVNSSAFKKFVTSRTILAQIQTVLEKKFK
jgi:hypothetical protein